MKKRKLVQVEELIANLSLTREEVIEYLSGKNCQSQIKAGMFWYEDDSFSVERDVGKKVKAIVELMKDGVVYGDLTASELVDIPEKLVSWDDAKKYIEEFSYPCNENEKIVWYDDAQLDEIYKTYDEVRIAFFRLHKDCRMLGHWSSRECDSLTAGFLYFHNGKRYVVSKDFEQYIRPVIAMKIS